MSELTARDIAQMLNAQAEALAWYIFPQGHVAGGYFRVGSLQGEAGDSLVIRLRGPRAGGWADYSDSESSERGKGDMLQLIQYTLADGSLRHAVQLAKQWLNLDSMDPGALERQKKRAELARQRSEKQDAKDREKTREDARRLWHMASPLTPASPPVAYLTGRAIDFKLLGRLPGAIRFHPEVWHDELKRKVPAMVTAFQEVEPRHAATHITYLERNKAGRWVKLTGVKSAKKIRGRPYWGAHIPIWKGAQAVPLCRIAPGTPVYVAEGIEDALSYAMANPEARVLAAGTLGNVGQLQLPAHAGDLFILADRDPEGSKAVDALADVIRKQQEQAKKRGAKVKTIYPAPGFKDFNEWLQALRAEAA